MVLLNLKQLKPWLQLPPAFRTCLILEHWAQTSLILSQWKTNREPQFLFLFKAVIDSADNLSQLNLQSQNWNFILISFLFHFLFFLLSLIFFFFLFFTFFLFSFFRCFLPFFLSLFLILPVSSCLPFVFTLWFYRQETGRFIVWGSKNSCQTSREIWKTIAMAKSLFMKQRDILEWSKHHSI